MNRGFYQALCIGLTAALLAACGESHQPLGLLTRGGAMAQRAPETSSYEVLYRFDPRHAYAGGANPDGGLIDAWGTLYGTTERGGHKKSGTVYLITPTGRTAFLYRFRGSAYDDGSDPTGDLTYSDDTLYGTTVFGGSCGSGTVYSITITGSEKNLYSFCSDETNPTGGVINVHGTLYGTAGSNSSGEVYSVSELGAYKVLYKFGGPGDGAQPAGRLLNVKGDLYGTTISGGEACHKGSSGCGTVYRVTRSGKEKVLYRFQGGSDGMGPRSGLIEFDGTVYGTTIWGGQTGSGCSAFGCGTVYSISANGKEKVLYRFAGGSDGYAPDAALLEMNGTLYGTTTAGGAAADGTVFSVSASGGEQLLHSFAGGSDGATPDADLLDVNGTLYGTTLDGGGTSGCGSKGCGTVFALTP